jgi:hypothetical protein
LIRQFQSSEAVAPEVSNAWKEPAQSIPIPWNSRQVSRGVQRGQRREQQGGEEREVGFHRSLDGGMTPKFKPEIRQFTTKPQSHQACRSISAGSHECTPIVTNETGVNKEHRDFIRR